MTDILSGRTDSMVAPPLIETRAEDIRETVIPLFEEELAVSKRVVPTSHVQVSRVTDSHEQFIDELLVQRYSVSVLSSPLAQ